MTKKLIALALSISLLLSMSVCAYAENQTSSTSGEMGVPATLRISSSYTLQAPATITLDRIDNTDADYGATYDVGVKGNIADTEMVRCTPSGTTFSMTSGSNSTTARLSQPIDTWVNTPSGSDPAQTQIGSDDFSNAQGTISVTLPKSGEYTGQFTLSFSLTQIL